MRRGGTGAQLCWWPRLRQHPLQPRQPPLKPPLPRGYAVQPPIALRVEAQRALPVLWVGGPDVAPRYRFRALQPTADEANGRGVWADLSDEEVRLLVSQYGLVLRVLSSHTAFSSYPKSRPRCELGM